MMDTHNGIIMRQDEMSRPARIVKIFWEALLHGSRVSSILRIHADS